MPPAAVGVAGRGLPFQIKSIILAPIVAYLIYAQNGLSGSPCSPCNG